MKKLFVALVLIPLSLIAESLTPAQLKQYLEDMKASNDAIDHNMNQMLDQCENQKRRREIIDFALSANNDKIRALQQRMLILKEIQAPLIQALKIATMNYAEGQSEIDSIKRKLSLLGKPNDQMRALLKRREEQSSLVQELSKQRHQLRSNYLNWEATGDNGRALDEALELMSNGTSFEQLTPEQQQLVARHKAFLIEDQLLADRILYTIIDLHQIETDILQLRANRAQIKSELEKQLASATKKRNTAQSEINRYSQQVKKYNELIDNLTGAINKLSGFRAVEISENCRKLDTF